MTRAKLKPSDLSQNPPNQQDKRLKLTDKQILEAYEASCRGWAARDLAATYGISKALMHAYLRGARAVSKRKEGEC